MLVAADNCTVFLVVDTVSKETRSGTTKKFTKCLWCLPFGSIQSDCLPQVLWNEFQNVVEDTHSWKPCNQLLLTFAVPFDGPHVSKLEW